MARILLVNDEADLVEITKMVLEDAGHRVTALTEGRKAVETAFRICPDILILDWNLDGITAEEVLRQLRLDSRTARLPILLISGRAESEIRARMFGIDGFLRKPFDGNTLVHSVSEVLARTFAVESHDLHA